MPHDAISRYRRRPWRRRFDDKKYSNQQAGLLALALGGPPVWVRSMGGGSLVWRAVVFVWRAAHRDGEVGDLLDVGRDGGIRGGGG